MNVINFSYHYNKFGIDFSPRVFLLHVFIENTKNFHPRFVEYDTGYYVGVQGLEYYYLPRGKVLVLLLKVVDEQKVFTTIRRWTPQKEKYYRSKIGEFFELKLVKEKLI